MHRFDPELVAALAEGTLEAAEAAELEAQIAGDPRLWPNWPNSGRRSPPSAPPVLRGSMPPSALPCVLPSPSNSGLTPSESPSVTRPRRVAWGQSPLPPRRCLQSLPSPP